MKIAAKTILVIMGLTVSSVPVCVRAQQTETVSDSDIKVAEFAELPYPQIARTARLGGVVVIRVKLDDEGRVTDAVAISGLEIFVRDCLTNAKKWRFQPNSRKAAVIVYNFAMPGGLCKSASSFFMFRSSNIAMITGCDETVQTAK
jgi:TonB family protein